MRNHRIFRAFLALLLCMTMILPLVLQETEATPLNNISTRKDFEGLRLSVIGDSITAYYGVSNALSYNPLYLTTSEATFGTYYGNSSHGDYAEISQVKWTDTWWKQVADTLGMELLVNNAWSGSFVCPIRVRVTPRSTVLLRIKIAA